VTCSPRISWSTVVSDATLSCENMSPIKDMWFLSAASRNQL
jgi:hypothetical protein